MTYKKTIGDFLKQLEFDADFYDVYGEQELLDQANYFLDEYDIEIKEGCDYRNDQNENGWYYCDMASEWAQSMVDIYHSDLRENAKRFQYFIEEAINDFGFDTSKGLPDLFQFGQWLYYDRLAGYVLNKFADYVKA